MCWEKDENKPKLPGLAHIKKPVSSSQIHIFITLNFFLNIGRSRFKIIN